MTLQTFGPHEVGQKGHVKYPTPKHCENSLQGSRYFKNHGCKTNDLDLLPDKVLHDAVVAGAPLTAATIAGHIRNDHWPDPFRHDGFKDPKHLLGRGDLMHEMHPFEIDRLYARSWFHGVYRTYHIPTVEQQFHLCGQIHLQALIEPKQSPVWLRPEVWTYLAHLASATNCHTAVYSLMHECIPLAQAAGFKAWRIY